LVLQLIEFDDVDKTANLNRYAAANGTWIKSYSLASVSWSNISIDKDSAVELTVTGIDELLPAARNGSVTFKVFSFSVLSTSSCFLLGAIQVS
jgi:hypothetical protein